VKEKVKMCRVEPSQRQTKRNTSLCTIPPLAKPLIVLIAKEEIVIGKRKIAGASTVLQSG
jgi:hypothetical protein